MQKNSLTNIVMLTHDEAQIDRRIIHQAKTLIDLGHKVSIIAWNAGKLPEYRQVDGVDVYHPLLITDDNAWKIKYKGTLVEKLEAKLLKYKSKTQTKTAKYYVKSQINAYRYDSPLKITKNIKNYFKISIFKPFSWTLDLMRFGLGTLSWTLNTLSLGNKTVLLQTNSRFRSFCKFKNLVHQYLNSRKMMQPYVEDQDILMVQSALSLRPDVVHVHDLPSLTAGFILKDWLQVPLIYDMHEFFPEQEFISAENKAFYYQKERYLMPMVDIAYTVNPLLAKEIEEEYRVPVGSIQNSMVELPGFDLTQRHNRFREEYGLPEDSILVLYQGLISPVRNNEPFIEGMKHLKDTPFILLFMGYGDEQYLKQLQTLIDSSGLSKKVYLIPSKSQDELLYYSASADIGLIPYYNKPSKNIKYVSPNKLYEFIAAGLPILSNELEFVKSVIEPQGFGQCANLESPEGFAQALKNFPIHKLQDFKQNLREKRHLFMWDAESVKLVEFYQKLKLPNARMKEKIAVASH